MEEHSRKPSLLAKDGQWALTTGWPRPGGVCVAMAKTGSRGGGRGADMYPGSNSQGPQGPPDCFPVSPASLDPPSLCRILAALWLVLGGRPSSSPFQDLPLFLCSPGLALTFNSAQRGHRRPPIKSPPHHPLLPSGFICSGCCNKATQMGWLK